MLSRWLSWPRGCNVYIKMLLLLTCIVCWFEVEQQNHQVDCEESKLNKKKIVTLNAAFDMERENNNVRVSANQVFNVPFVEHMNAKYIIFLFALSMII